MKLRLLKGALCAGLLMTGICSGESDLVGYAEGIVNFLHYFITRTGVVVRREYTLRCINTLSQSRDFVAFLQNTMNSELWDQRFTRENGSYVSRNTRLYDLLRRNIQTTLNSNDVISSRIAIELMGAMSSNAQQALADLAVYMDEVFFNGRSEVHL